MGPRSSLRLSAALVVGGAVLSGPVAMLVIALVAPQPAWVSVNEFASHYRPLQAAPYLLGYVLLCGFVLFTAAAHALAPSTMRTRTTAAVIFTSVYAVLVFVNYTLQVAFIPRVIDDTPDYVAVLTMTNPASLAWFLEMFGYAALGVSTWLISPLFHGTTRAVVIRRLLILNGVVSIAGAAFTALYDEWVFSKSGLVAFAAWNALVLVCFGLIALPDPPIIDTAPARDSSRARRVASPRTWTGQIVH